MPTTKNKKLHHKTIRTKHNEPLNQKIQKTPKQKTRRDPESQKTPKHQDKRRTTYEEILQK